MQAVAQAQMALSGNWLDKLAAILPGQQDKLQVVMASCLV